MLKNFTRFAALLAIAAVIVPTVALAHGGGRGGDDSNDDRRDRGSVGAWTTNEFGVKVFGTNTNANADSSAEVKGDRDFRDFPRGFHKDKGQRDDNGLHLGHFKNRGFIDNLFYNGTVTATSSTGFTIEAKDGTDFTVDADSAKIIQVPRTVIALGDIEVGVTVHITGTKTSDTTVEASVVYVMPANLQPAMAKGTVTAVNDDNITVQTSEDTSITVNTDADTVIKDENGDVAAQSDIEIGMSAKLFGLWDSVLNVFNAFKIKLS